MTASGVARRWNAFWYESGSPVGLALFRMAFAYALWREVDTTREKAIFAVAGDGFHLPYLDFLPLLSESTYQALHSVQLPLIVLFGLGLFTRLSCGALIAIQGYVLFADQLNFRNHPYFFWLLLVLFLFSPADEALSVRAGLRALRRRLPIGPALLGTPKPLTFQRMMQVQVCIAYVYAGLHKVHAAYLRGDILRDNLGEDLLEGTSGRWLRRWFEEDSVRAFVEAPVSMTVAAWLTVILELGLPIALWSRRVRPWALVLGIGFHLGIAFTMSIRTFSMAMIASYLLFLDPGTPERVLRRAAAAVRTRLGR